MAKITSRFRILKLIGEKPYLTKDEIAEELNLSKHNVASQIGRERNYGNLVKAPSYDQEKGLHWELTGSGYRKVMDKIEELENILDTDIPKPTLHQFKPLNKRRKYKLDDTV